MLSVVKKMNEYSMVRFFNQLIHTMKNNIKNIGIITDKDGTILLNDELRQVLENFKTKNLETNIYLIANSGRTVADMVNSLNKENIPLEYFDYIVGDNGGMCLDVKENTVLFKNVMEKVATKAVIDYFIENNGHKENIRLADGKNIYAYPKENIKKYYENTKDVVFTEDICDTENIDITKITFVGSHKQIEDLNKYIGENFKKYKTHIGRTTFPEKQQQNYRMDFTRYAYKRNGI